MNTEQSFLSFLSQVLVVGLGWYVVHKLSVARDRDKSRREMVVKATDGLIDALSELLTDARTYHTTAHDITLELKIKMTLQDASMRVALMYDVCLIKDSVSRCSAAIGALRRAITGNHFEDEHLGPLSQADAQLQEIAAAVLKAKQDMLKLKHGQFPA